MPSALLPWIFPLSVETTRALASAGPARVTAAAAAWPCPGAAHKKTPKGRTAASPATLRRCQGPILRRRPGVLLIMTTSRPGKAGDPPAGHQRWLTAPAHLDAMPALHKQTVKIPPGP